MVDENNSQLEDQAEHLDQEAVNDMQKAEVDEKEVQSNEASAVAADDLVATNSGVDLSASNLPKVEDDNTVSEPVENVNNPIQLTPAEEAQKAADPTPAQEAAVQVATANSTEVATPNTVAAGMPIDASNIGQTTNSDVIGNLPTDENGQVQIDENGAIVGLDASAQPAPGNISASMAVNAASAVPTSDDSEEGSESEASA
jgi:hypothetical protein